MFCTTQGRRNNTSVRVRVCVCTNQLDENARAGGQQRVEVILEEHKELVRGAPYADDEGGHDEHVQEHVEHGERESQARRWRPLRVLARLLRLRLRLQRRLLQPLPPKLLRVLVVGRHKTALGKRRMTKTSAYGVPR